MDLSFFYTVDEDGNRVELPRPETKSFDDVLQCITHNKGKNDSIVDRFIELALLGLQWDWFDDYKKWLCECEKVKELNASLAPDEVTGEQPEHYPLPIEPPLPPQTTISQWKRNNYRALRLAAYGRVTDQLDMMQPGVDRFKSDWLHFVADVRNRYPK